MSEDNILRKENAVQMGEGGIFLWKRKFSSHSKNIMFRRRALYRTVGMTQQASQWQPVWAAGCSGRQEHSHQCLWQLSSLSYRKMGKVGKFQPRLNGGC